MSTHYRIKACYEYHGNHHYTNLQNGLVNNLLTTVSRKRTHKNKKHKKPLSRMDQLKTKTYNILQPLESPLKLISEELKEFHSTSLSPPRLQLEHVRPWTARHRKWQERIIQLTFIKIMLQRTFNCKIYKTIQNKLKQRNRYHTVYTS